MKVFLLFPLILLCAHQITASDDDTTAEAECTKYMEKLLENTFANHKDKLDPQELEEKTFSFNVTSPFSLLEYGIQARLHDGRMEGMSKGRRSGKCVVTEGADVDYLETLINFRDVRISFKGTLTVLFGLAGHKSMTVYVRGRPMIARIRVKIALPRDSSPPQVREAQIDNFSKLSYNYDSIDDGLGIFRVVMEPFKQFVSKIFPSLFKITLVNNNLQECLNYEAGKLEFPL